jgi:hypothetical protein
MFSSKSPVDIIDILLACVPGLEQRKTPEEVQDGRQKAVSSRDENCFRTDVRSFVRHAEQRGPGRAARAAGQMMFPLSVSGIDALQSTSAR